MERSIIREKTVKDHDYFERIKIGIMPICQGAGATLVATSIAKLLSEDKSVKVSFVEISKEKTIGSKYTYDSIGMEKRFASRIFNDFFYMTLVGETTRGCTNIDDGINWILHKPKMISSLNPIVGNNAGEENLKNYRIINNASGDIIICDFEIHPEGMELLQDMDVLIVVIDPMPSSLISGFNTIAFCKNLQEKGHKIVWVLNKDNDGINKREMHKFLKIKELIYIPLIKGEELYSSEYNCLLPISKRSIRIVVETPLMKIIKSIFG